MQFQESKTGSTSFPTQKLYMDGKLSSEKIREYIESLGNRLQYMNIYLMKPPVREEEKPDILYML